MRLSWNGRSPPVAIAPLDCLLQDAFPPIDTVDVPLLLLLLLLLLRSQKRELPTT
jgi:hypothetical protein